MRRKLFLCVDLHGKEVSVWMPAREFYEGLYDGGKFQHDGRTLQWLGSEPERRGGCAIWPMRSDGAGVHPRQAKQAWEESCKNGVPTEFDSTTGQAIFRDRSHRRRYLKAFGMHDRDGGYGD